MRVSSMNNFNYMIGYMNNSKSSSSDLLGSINLSDYSTIKSGGYGKLLKAYYASDVSGASKSAGSYSDKVNFTDTYTKPKSVDNSSAKSVNFLDTIVGPSSTDKKTEVKSVNFLDTLVPKSAKAVAVDASETDKVNSSKDAAAVEPDYTKALYNAGGSYGDMSSVLAGAFFNTSV